MTALEGLLLALSVAAAIVGWGGLRRRRVVARLGDGGGLDLDLDDPPLEGDDGADFLRRPRWVALAAAVAAAAGLALLGLGSLVSLAGGALVGAIATQLESFWFVRRQVRLESQLAEALDLMVGALHAGVGLVDALAAGATRVGDPMRSLLLDMVERLRVGDAPVEALTSLGRRVPLETFRLAGLTLGASWEGGGGYAEALAGVGRTTRGRLALRRRINSQSLEARISAGVVLVVTWGLFGLTLGRDPDSLRAFLEAEVGDFMLASVLGLQALGLVWIDSIAGGEL